MINKENMQQRKRRKTSTTPDSFYELSNQKQFGSLPGNFTTKLNVLQNEYTNISEDYSATASGTEKRIKVKLFFFSFSNFH